MSLLVAKKIYKVGNYVCEVDDINYDNKEESIIMIYKSEKDYKNGNYMEQVSLNNKDIKENITNYIKNNYLVKIKER